MNELRNFLEEEAEKPFSGWDFSYIADRFVTAPLSWSYTSILIQKIRHVRSMLDMDTGGGEKLSSLQPLPQFTCATERYKPNIPFAQSRLEPLGVQVFTYESNENMPFADDQFELISNRHGSYNPEEIWRILQPGGELITQQVGSENDLDINRMLGAPAESDWDYWDLVYAKKQLEHTGFDILVAKEDFPITRVFDAGALVYHLTAIPWQVPDFSIEAYFESLQQIHKKIESQGFIDITSHRFLIVSKKPKN